MKSFIHTLHIFDYICKIIENESSKFVAISNDDNPLGILQTDSYLNRLLEIHK